jgi:nickel-type superoxide dismutase maturation protease
MEPLLKPGDEVLVMPKRYWRSPLRVEDVVVTWHPYQPGLKLIKRVVAIEGDRYVLHGDNLAESTDSRTFGAVPLTMILGRVTCRFL